MTESLDQAANELNNAIAVVNDALAQKYRVQVEMNIDDFILGYGKIGDCWRLYIVTGDNGRVPLETASRKKRIDSCTHLRELGVRLDDESRVQMAMLRAAASIARDFATHLASSNHG